MKKLLIISLIFLQGCVSYQTIDRELSKCPEYFRQNTGKPVIKLVSFRYSGYVRTDKPDEFVIFRLNANKDVILEESFHSFELLALQNRVKEWERFYYDYGRHNDFVEHLESAADDFILLIRQKRYNKAIEKFIRGEYK